MGWREVGSRAEAAQSPVPAPASRLSVPGALGGSARGSLDLALLYLPLIEEEEQRKSSNLIIIFFNEFSLFLFGLLPRFQSSFLAEKFSLSVWLSGVSVAARRV